MADRAIGFEGCSRAQTAARAVVILAALAAGSGFPRALSGQQPPSHGREVPVSFAARGDTVAAFEGTVRVLADRSAPASGSLELRYVRFPSTAEDAGAPIVYLAGGPGGSGIAGARGSRFDFLMALRRVADVIAFDQRGTGASQPRDVVCTHEAGIPLDRPGTSELFLGILRTETGRCIKYFDDAGVTIGGLTTTESADDLEALRRELGVERLSLLGVSYGTHLALAAVRRHPESFERIVLAGIEGPNQTIKLPANVEASLGKLAEMIARDPVYGERLPNLVAVLDSLVTELSRRPRSWTVLPGRTVMIGGWDLQRFVAEMVGRRNRLMELPAIVDAMTRGDFTELARWSYRERQPASTHIMNLAMDCASYASAERLGEIRRQAPGTVLGATTDFPLPGLCGVPGLPRLGDTFRSLPTLTIPTLLISGTLDGRTPVSNAEEVATRLPQATMMTIENAAHGSELILASPRILEGITAFLRADALRNLHVRLPPWSFDPPTERSLAGDVLDRLVERGFEATARWYGRAMAEHAGGRVYDFDAGVLNRLGYDLLAAGETVRAIDVFRLNTIGHPGKANPWDSLGEAYLADGNLTQAIINYRRSLRLNPANDNARRILQELEAEE